MSEVAERVVSDSRLPFTFARKHGVLVRSQIVRPNDAPVSINYVMHDNDEAWQIRDVYLGGSISELATRRSEFTGILRNAGVDGLIAVLNKKADELVG